MTFQEQMKEDMGVFCSHFKETITYYPHGGDSVEAEVIVDREQPLPYEVEGAIPIVDFQVTIPTSVVPTVTKGKDAIDVDATPGGGDTVRALITEILESDEAAWRLVAMK